MIGLPVIVILTADRADSVIAFPDLGAQELLEGQRVGLQAGRLVGIFLGIVPHPATAGLACPPIQNWLAAEPAEPRCAGEKTDATMIVH